MDAAILAGGRARRLGGQDKRALRVGPTTILERQLAALDGLVDRVFVVGGNRLAGGGPLPAVVTDRLPNAGALGGLYTALCEAAGSHVLVVACDLPFVTSALLATLISLADSGCDAVVPRSTDGLQPLCAVYARRLAGEVRGRIESGRLKIAGPARRDSGPGIRSGRDRDVGSGGPALLQRQHTGRPRGGRSAFVTRASARRALTATIMARGRCGKPASTNER